MDEGLNYIPFAAAEELMQMHVRLQLVKSMVETGHMDREQASKCCEAMTDIECRAGGLYESLRDRLDGKIAPEVALHSREPTTPRDGHPPESMGPVDKN